MEHSLLQEAEVAAIILAKIKELKMDGETWFTADGEFGSEVRVRLVNPHPRDMNELKQLADKHTIGSYSDDGETYNFDLIKIKSEKLPRAMYVRFYPIFTSEYRQRALDAIIKTHELEDMIVEFIDKFLKSDDELEKVLLNSENRCADMWDYTPNN